jgi:hypothetical protein
MHMLLVNLATIYQGNIPNLLHTQTHVEILYRMHLKYTLTRELDPQLAHFTRELPSTNPIREWHPQPLFLLRGENHKQKIQHHPGIPYPFLPTHQTPPTTQPPTKKIQPLPTPTPTP